jgi:hypothetical protein
MPVLRSANSSLRSAAGSAARNTAAATWTNQPSQDYCGSVLKAQPRSSTFNRIQTLPAHGKSLANHRAGFTVTFNGGFADHCNHSGARIVKGSCTEPRTL